MSYKVSPLRTKKVDKADGGHRTLSMPVIGDRILFLALNRALGPYLNAQLAPEMHGSRPGHSVHTVLLQLEGLVKAGLHVLVTADILKAFDNVEVQLALEDLAALMQSDDPVEQANRSKYLDLITVILAGSERRPKKVGIAQGSALSPLIFLVHMQSRLYAKLVVEQDSNLLMYVDNLVAISKAPDVALALIRQARNLLSDAGLRLKEEQTVADLSLGAEVTLFGFQTRLEGDNLEYRIPDTAWDKLAQMQGECFAKKNPNRAAFNVTRGWITHFRPCLREQTEETVQKAVKLLEVNGFTNYWLPELRQAAGNAAQQWARERSNWLSGSPSARVLRAQANFSEVSDTSSGISRPDEGFFVFNTTEEFP
jgi:hypothetical protein